MASQPPIQQNTMPSMLPGSSGYPRPTFVSNGTGQIPGLGGHPAAAASPRLPQPPPPSFGPLVNTSINQQWSRPPTASPGPVFPPASQPVSTGTHQQFTSTGAHTVLGGAQAPMPRLPLQNQVIGRPSSSTSVTSPSSSGAPSNQASTNPSPTPNLNYDRMEGQFPTNGVSNPPPPGSNIYRPTPVSVNGNVGFPTVNGARPTLPYAASTDNSMPFMTNGVYPPSTAPALQLGQPGANAPGSGYAPSPHPPYNTGFTGQTNGPQQTAPTPSGTPWATPYPPSYPPAQGQYPPPTGMHLPQDGRRQYPQQMSYPPTTNPPGSQYQSFNPALEKMTNQMDTMSVTQAGFDKLWGHDNVDLLQIRHILPPQGVEAPQIRLRQEHLNNAHCSPDIFRCTLTKIPETSSLLQKSRLPLGVLIHPFKDLTQLPVVQCQTIVRCRSCRTYINPFVYFVDQRRWKCNLCFRVNDLPDDFQYDPMSNTYGDPTRRPEIKNATIEFIAPAEYMLRPPQPAVYLYLLDVSHAAVESGYVKLFCDVLLEELDKIPGDSRTQIGFMTYDSSVHFYNLAENLNRPHQMIVSDIDDIYLPCPNDLLVNLNESKRLVTELLEQLPTKFVNTPECSSALGAALQAAFKLISPTGGRITVFQCSLPNIGPGALKAREDPNQRAAKDVPNLNAATDFYKKFALDCSGLQVAVDLFLMGQQYMDIASLSCVSKFTGGCMYHFPGFHYIHNLPQLERMEHALRRYLTRKIGFESVMRIRCTHGLSIHSFHGNFFVRSTDLLSLPNINPDAGFGLQVSIDENLTDAQNVCFQAALLYTSSKGERRIRVHTMCLPIASTVADVIQSADQQCIVGLLAKMAVDRSLHSNIGDARDALVNVCVDVLSAYKAIQGSSSSGLYAPANLKLLPLYIAALLKSVAFRTGQSTRLDDRVFAMNQFKVMPLSQLILSVYPDLYAVHNLTDQGAISQGDLVIPQPPRLHLSAEMVDSTGAYLLDTGEVIFLYVGRNISPAFLENVLGARSYQSLPDQMFELPELDTHEAERLKNFLIHLQNRRPYPAVLQLVKEDGPIRHLFTAHLVDGRTESSLSYYEFLQHLKNQIK